MLRSEAWVWLARGVGATVGVIIVASIAAVVLGASNVLVQVGIAILLASGLEPMVTWLRAKTGLARSVNIIFVYLGFMVIVVLLLILIVPAAVTQLTEFSSRLPSLLTELRAFAADIRPSVVSDGLVNALDALAATMRNPEAEADTEALVDVGLAVADLLIAAITILTLVFFWLIGHQRIQRFMLALLPREHRAGVRRGWNEVELSLGLWVRGQGILMAFIFVMTTIAYLVLGLPNALLLGLIAGIAEIIPIVGPILGAIPALLVAAVTGEIELVLLVAGVYVVIQVLEGNILVPMVMKKTIGMPPFLVVASLVVGAAVGGLIGAVLAVPLVAAMVVILQRAQDRQTFVKLEGGGSSSVSEAEDEERGDEERGDEEPQAGGDEALGPANPVTPSPPLP